MSHEFKKKEEPNIPLTQIQLDILNKPDFWRGNYCLDYSLPWICPQSIIDLVSILKPEFKVLEFGSGGSTLFLSERVSEVVSFEAGEVWIEKVKQEIKKKEKKNIKLNLVSRQSELIKAISSFPENYFDLVIVDIGTQLQGRSREQLFLASIPKMITGAYYVLDNGLSQHHYPSMYNWKKEDFSRVIKEEYLVKNYDMKVNQYSNTRLLYSPNKL